jgi:hypothetical protein
LAAKVCELIYAENDSPLQYRVNRLGGRSQKAKWILQAELFNEVHRWVEQDWRTIERRGTKADRYYAVIRDFFKAAERVWGEAWSSPAYMVTKPVTLKALVRVCADLYRADPDPDTPIWRGVRRDEYYTHQIADEDGQNKDVFRIEQLLHALILTDSGLSSQKQILITHDPRLVQHA